MHTTEELQARIAELEAKQQREQAVVAQAQLVQNTYQALIAAHEALIATHEGETAMHTQTIEALQESEERFEILVEGVKDYALFLLDSSGRVASWNAGAERITGYAADEIIGRDCSCFFPEDARQRGEPQRQLQVAAAEGRFETEGLRVRKDSSHFWANVVVTALYGEEGQLRGFAEVAHDITARKRAEQRLAVQYTVSRVLAEATAVDEAAPRILAAIAESLGWQIGAFWIVNQDAGMLQCRAVWHVPDLAETTFETACRHTELRPGIELPGKVLVSREPVWVTDILTESTMPRLADALQAGLHAAFAFPVQNGREPLGVIELFSRTTQPPDPELLHTVTALGNQIGQFIERTRAEAATRVSEARKAAILEGAFDCVITVDHTGRIIEWNPAAEQTFGYNRADVLGRDIADLIIPPSLRERHRQGLARYFVTGEGSFIGRRVEITGMRADGSKFPVELAITRIPTDGPPIFTGYLRDITERTQAEESLRFLAEASRLVASSLDYPATLAQVTRLAVPFLADCCAVDVLSPDQSIHRTALAHVDPAKEEVLRTLQERSPLDPSRLEPVSRVLQTGQPEIIPDITDEVLETLAPDPEQSSILRSFNFESAMIVPLVAHGRTLGTLFFAAADSGRRYQPRDLMLAQDLAAHVAFAVDNAQLYDEAQRAIRARDEFLSVAAHEMRRPLHPLLAAAGLLELWQKSEQTTSKQEQRALSVIAEATRRLNTLVESLVNLARIESSQMYVERQPVDLGALAGRIVAEFQQMVGAWDTRHSIHLVCPEEPLVVEGDEMQLELVLRNLLDNAIKYSPKSGSVEVCIEQRGDQAWLGVRDQGIGIPEEAQAHLFQRFYRGNNAGQQQSSGMGIGLYLVKEIVSLHGGSVEVRSKAGQGSTFGICLPLAHALAQQQATSVIASAA